MSHLLAAAAYLLLGYGLCFRLRLPKRGLEGFAWAYGLGTGAASLLLLGFVSSGLWGVLVSSPFDGVIVIAAVALAVGWPVLYEGIAVQRRLLRKRRRSPTRVILFVVLLFAVLRLPSLETGWDALAYHLPVADRFAHAGGGPMFGLLDGEFRVGFDILFMPGLELDGSLPSGTGVVHLVAAIALAAGIAAEAARRTSRAVGWAIGGLFVLTPGVMLIATHAYVDVGVGLYVFLALAAASLALRERRTAPVIAAGLFAGFAANAKLPAAAAVAAVAVAFLAGGGLRRGARDAAISTLVALVIAAPWFVRAWWNTGNPFFPALLDRFGSGWADREVVEATKRTVLGQLGLPRDGMLPFRGVIHAVFDPRGGFEAPAWVLAFLPAALLRPNQPDRRGLVAGSVVLLAAWGAFVPLFRFGIGLWAWAAVAAAVGMARLARERRIVQFGLAGVLLAFVVLGVVPVARRALAGHRHMSAEAKATMFGPAAAFGGSHGLPSPTGLSSSFIALVPGWTMSLEPQRNGLFHASDFDDPDRLYAACRRAGLRSLLLDDTTVEGRKALAHAAVWTKERRATVSMRAGSNGSTSWIKVVFPELNPPR